MGTSRNAQLVANELRRFGMPDLKVNALVGGFQQESGAELNPTVSHDGGTGFGIAGFRDPEPGVGRWSNLRNFAQANGWDVNDPVTQARFSAHELGYDDPETGRMKGPGYNAESRASAMMRNATTLEGAAKGAIAYERPQHFSWDNPSAGHGFSNRLANAQRLAGLPVTGGTENPRPYTGNGIKGAMAHAPTVERAAAMAASPDLAAAQAMRPHSAPDSLAADAPLELSDLTSLDGWRKALKDDEFSEGLQGVLSTAAGQQEQSNAAATIDPAVALANSDSEFASRFATASQMMSGMRKPRGILAGVR